jgi:hypothetical protein|tara:strand:- start:577 stop:1083 length:507 start_codon:yes stop_codon:yes gene_type:complete
MMSKFASGKNAYAVSDRSGQRYRYKQMRREWNGLLVGRDEYEAKHPQLGPFRITSDPQALKDARPDRTEPSVQQILKKNAFLSGSAGSAVITVTETNHGRTTGNTVRFRKANGFDGFSSTVLENSSGYTISVISTDTYTFTASSGTATTGGKRGGGENATVGPVSLEA